MPRENHIEVVQYLRYHMEPANKPKRARASDGEDRDGEGRKRRRRKATALEKLVQETGAPYAGTCLIFDAETTPFDGQKFRFGPYLIYGIHPERRLALAQSGRLTREALDELAEKGFAYEPKNMTTNEVSRLASYASRNDFVLMTRTEFIEQVLVGTGRYWQDHWKPERKAGTHGLVIGFNLPFDIAAVATDYRMAIGEFYGGFTFRLCECQWEGMRKGAGCKYHPGIRIMPYSTRKHRFGWLVESIPVQGSKGEHNSRTLRFLDVGTFARALLGPGGGGKLSALCETLNTKTRKIDRDDHGAELTDEYIDYAVNDVQATWECYSKLRDLYRQHGVSKEMSNIYSEASLGKGYFDDIGIPPFSEAESGFPKANYWKVHGNLFWWAVGGPYPFATMRHRALRLQIAVSLRKRVDAITRLAARAKNRTA